MNAGLDAGLSAASSAVEREKASAQASRQQTIVLPVIGMTCASCQHHVESALKETAGVRSARVDLLANRANVTFDTSTASAESLVAAIRSAGYDSALPRDASHKGARGESVTDTLSETEGRGWIKAWTTLIAGALAMLASMPLSPEMSSVDHGLMQWMPWLCGANPTVLRWSLLAVTAMLMVWAGGSIYANAARALMHGSTTMNTLVSLGTGVAFAWSAYASLSPAAGRAVYFDAVLLILGFLLLGKSLEARAKQRALAAIHLLAGLQPLSARRIRDDMEETVSLDAVEPGDRVRVLPGERFPVDAVILEGRTTVDESMLTGEPTPQPRGPGDRVLAGSLNYDGSVICRAESLGESTVLAQITKMVEQAQGSRAPLERVADRASAIFVPIVLALAALTFAAWLLFTHSVGLAMANTVAVLVVACPCAMGLAVPAALTVAVGRSAQLGILFKGGEALERLVHIDTVILDKTGTLTVGRPQLEAIHAFGSHAEADLLRIAASAEEQSNHPLAHSIVDHARAQGLEWSSASDLQNYPGRGLSATIDGQQTLLGNELLFREFFVTLPADVPAPSPGVTRMWLAIDSAAAGYFDARDQLRADAAEAITSLRRSPANEAGMRVLMLTGDTAVSAAPIAKQAGIDEVEAGLDPAGKLARIRALQDVGRHVAMVGDGINDAAALAQADAGIAMGSGADLAQEAGDVILLRPQPRAIPQAIELARATIRIMKQNLGWAVGYNLLTIPLAAGLLYPAFHLLLSPWIASAAMALSSICVLGNSLRLRVWQPRS